MSTTIEWTQRPGTKGETWNPTRGCTIISQGCRNCYAMKFAHRFSGPGKPYEGLTKKTNSGVKWTGKVHLAEDMLENPLMWREPRTAFVDSMSDLFHEDVPVSYIAKVFGVMWATQDLHTHLILTKRAQRMLSVLTSDEFFEHFVDAVNNIPTLDHLPYTSMVFTPEEIRDRWPLKNVWLGVSCEDQHNANERIPLLLQVPAVVRFLSCEPLISHINISDWLYPKEFIGMPAESYDGKWHTTLQNDIHWVIAGGESGPDARPMHPDWVRSLRDQCKAAGVPFFFKQWGSFLPYERVDKVYNIWRSSQSAVYIDGEEVGDKYKSLRKLLHKAHINGDQVAYRKWSKKMCGNYLDGAQHLEFPNMKEVANG